MIQDIIIAPFLLGLSVGAYCLAYCAPFIAPVVAGGKRSGKQDVLLILKFLGGRLAGYVVFGAVFGYLGANLDGAVFDFILSLSLILLAALLIMQAAGFLHEKNRYCAVFKRYDSKYPLVMGFLMGVNVCPPFLISLTYVLTLHDALKGVIYFLMFFLGTSVYFIPMFFFRVFSFRKEFQLGARIAGLAIGAIFLAYGFYAILWRID